MIATDFTEDGVELLEANIALNSSRLRAARLDVTNTLSLCALLDTAHDDGRTEAAAHDVWLCACDMSYDEVAIDALFAAAAELQRHANGRWRPVVWFARSSNFSHMDAHTVSRARARRFALAGSHAVRAAGVQDSISPTYLSPCVDDAVDIFVFEPCASAPDDEQTDTQQRET